jgi:hypothetical protein
MAKHVAINVPSHRELHTTVRAIVHIVSAEGQHLISHLMICLRPKACRRQLIDHDKDELRIMTK